MKFFALILSLLLILSKSQAAPLPSLRQTVITRRAVLAAKIPIVLAQKIYGRYQTNFWGTMWSSNVAALTVINVTNPPAPASTRLRLSATEDRSALARVDLDAPADKITLSGHWSAEYPLASPYRFFRIALKDESAALTWEPSPSEQVIGYKIYLGTESGTYTRVLDVGGDFEWTVAELTPGATYYFAVTACDASGAESEFSNEAAYTAPLVEPQMTLGTK